MKNLVAKIFGGTALVSSFMFSNSMRGQCPTPPYPIKKHYYEYINGEKIEVWEYDHTDPEIIHGKGALSCTVLYKCPPYPGPGNFYSSEVGIHSVVFEKQNRSNVNPPKKNYLQELNSSTKKSPYLPSSPTPQVSPSSKTSKSTPSTAQKIANIADNVNAVVNGIYNLFLIAELFNTKKSEDNYSTNSSEITSEIEAKTLRALIDAEKQKNEKKYSLDDWWSGSNSDSTNQAKELWIKTIGEDNYKKLSKTIDSLSYEALKNGPDEGKILGIAEFLESTNNYYDESRKLNTEKLKEDITLKFWEKSEKAEVVFGKPDEGAPENNFYHGTTKFQKGMKTGLYIIAERFPGANNILGSIEKGIELEKVLREDSWWQIQQKEAKNYFTKNKWYWNDKSDFEKNKRTMSYLIIKNTFLSAVAEKSSQVDEAIKRRFGDWLEK